MQLDRTGWLFKDIDEWVQTDDPGNSWVPLVHGKQQLYFIQVGLRGPIKIGLSKDPMVRMEALQTGNPEKLRMLWYCTPKSGRVERYLHSILGGSRLSGEWFKPTELLVEIINSVMRHCFDGSEYRSTRLIF